MRKKVLIIGGGIAGMSAALELAKCDFKVYLLEKESYIGGWVSSFCCKATDICTKCSVCLIKNKKRDVVTHPGISILTNSTIEKLEGEIDNFKVKILKKPRYIDPLRCIACNRCAAICPAVPKAIHSPLNEGYPDTYILNKTQCTYFKQTDCILCREECPVNAINFNKETAKLEFSVNAIITATGFDMFNIKQSGNPLYGKYSGVMTGFDLEKIFIHQGQLEFPITNEEPPSIAFIQCVGSRNDIHNYCSRVCCKYAMRFALLLKYQNPSISVTIFYIDIQNAGKGFDKVYEQCKKHIRFIRGLPVEVLKTHSNKLEVKYENILEGTIEMDFFDIVVLSTGIVPRRDSWDVARILGINLDEYGFFESTGISNSNETNVGGIFIAGSCQGPKNIPDSISHGIAAAEKVVEVFTKCKRV